MKTYLIFENGQTVAKKRIQVTEDEAAGTLLEGQFLVEASESNTPVDLFCYIDDEVKERPSMTHEWIDGDWVESRTAAEIQAEAMSRARYHRDALLEQSDWTQMSDSPLSTAKKAEWATYRQALRDMPASNSDVTDESEVVWPNKPD